MWNILPYVIVQLVSTHENLWKLRTLDAFLFSLPVVLVDRRIAFSLVGPGTLLSADVDVSPRLTFSSVPHQPTGSVVISPSLSPTLLPTRDKKAAELIAQPRAFSYLFGDISKIQ